MKFIHLLIALVLLATRNAELENKIKGFENITKALSMEVDRQRKEIETMKLQRKLLPFNLLRRVA
jgi:hypothetical protein